MPMGEGTGTHHKYFYPSPGDHKSHSKEPLHEQNINTSVFKKPKIFGCGSSSLI